MTHRRANCYKIDRIEYLPPADRYDWLCVMAWLGLGVVVVAFWGWVLL